MGFQDILHFVENMSHEDLKELMKEAKESGFASKYLEGAKIVLVPSSLRRYYRQTIANPEGTVAHYGDCSIYCAPKICDCGLPNVRGESP